MPEHASENYSESNPNSGKSVKFNSFLKRLKEKKQRMPDQQRSNPEIEHSNPNMFDGNGTRADWVSIGVNMLLGAFTIALFFQTRTATQAAVDSATSAQTAVNQQRFNDSIARRNDSLQSIVDSINRIERFEYDSIVLTEQKRSINAQIQQLHETQKEFKIQNESHLQIADFKIDTLKNGQPFFISYKVQNLGKNPAKILSTMQAVTLTYNPPSLAQLEKVTPDSSTIMVNTYITSEQPLPYPKQDVAPNVLMDKETIDDILNKKIFIYLEGIIHYQNTVTEQKRVYRFVIRVRFPTIGKQLFQVNQFLINENIDE